MGNYKITRTFYPVGQGGFYTEHHHDDDFKIVYDCGEWKRSNKAKLIVQSAFLKDDVIDVLFISHLDYDHISLIPTLMNSVKNIRVVVMPLLEDKEKNLLINLNRMLSKSILRIIKNPKAFFGPNTTIVYVSSDTEIDTDEGSLRTNSLRELADSGIRSHIIQNNYPLVYNRNSRWIFLPHNFKYQSRNSDLISKLNSNGFDINKLKNDPNYTVTTLGTTIDKNKLKKIYESLDGNINQNSMLLYSGPSHLSKNAECSCRFIGNNFTFSDSSLRSPGCIYTGDTDLNKIYKEQLAYSSYKDYVGVIQIPHHGSSHNFNIDFFEYFEPILCPVSFGTSNTYGHPVKSLINTLSIKGYKPILISEDPNSIITQEIELLCT